MFKKETKRLLLSCKLTIPIRRIDKKIVISLFEFVQRTFFLGGRGGEEGVMVKNVCNLNVIMPTTEQNENCKIPSKFSAR